MRVFLSIHDVDMRTDRETRARNALAAAFGGQVLVYGPNVFNDPEAGLATSDFDAVAFLGCEDGTMSPEQAHAIVDAQGFARPVYVVVLSEGSVMVRQYNLGPIHTYEDHSNRVLGRSGILSDFEIDEMVSRVTTPEGTEVPINMDTGAPMSESGSTTPVSDDLEDQPPKAIG